VKIKSTISNASFQLDNIYFEDDKMDSVWNGAFETLYRRKAAELTASLTTDEGYGNGNKTLLTRVLKGDRY
jgi:hypothetical protein